MPSFSAETCEQWRQERIDKGTTVPPCIDEEVREERLRLARAEDDAAKAKRNLELLLRRKDEIETTPTLIKHRQCDYDNYVKHRADCRRCAELNVRAEREQKLRARKT